MEIQTCSSSYIECDREENAASKQSQEKKNKQKECEKKETENVCLM